VKVVKDYSHAEYRIQGGFLIPEQFDPAMEPFCFFSFSVMDGQYAGVKIKITDTQLLVFVADRFVFSLSVSL
jgi:hypothetical protein